MKGKRIANIVFYKFKENGRIEKRACIFYNDGTVANTTYEGGIDACEIVIKERKITSRDAFKEMINREIIHVVTAKEFEKNFGKYVTHELITKAEAEDVIDHEMKRVVAETTPAKKEEKTKAYVPVKEVSKEAEEAKRVATPVAAAAPVAAKAVKKDETVSEEKKTDMPAIDAEIEADIRPDKKKEEKKGIAGFFQRMYNKFKKSRLGVKLTAISLAVLMTLGLASCANRKSKEGQMLNSNLATIETMQPTPTQDPNTIVLGGQRELVYGNNDYYNDYTFEELLQVTNNQTQKTAMSNLHTALTYFNGPFAAAHMEEGKDIRAALSFDEIVALQQAYNGYTKEQIRAIFNGAEIHADKMTRDYKNATLQLMGAHVIETSEHPVDMSTIIESEEGKAFYTRYHQLFLAAKEATGEDKLGKVKAFYDAVRADFPIGTAERTEGISHADKWADLEPYKLSVTPMIAAAEIMFQNLEVDYTLGDTEVDFLNDLGLCNVANATFKRIETITLGCCPEDNTNPLYEQYRNAIIKELVARGEYVIDDAHRDLSQLDAFQREVNMHGRWAYVGGTYTTTETWTETKTWTETETTTRVEEERIEAEIPDEERQKIDEEIDRQNEEERRRAEEEAERERQRLQEEADRQAEEIRQQIEQEEQDLQDKIEDANEQIEQNHDSNPGNDKPVNESDFGDHNVHFDDEHQDGNGNLNDSVEHITTDPTGDQTNEPLPDPNVTGAAFDARMDTAPAQPVAPAPQEPAAPAQPAEPAQPSNPSTDGGSTGYVEDIGGGASVEYPAGYTPFDGDGNPISNEDAVDAYVAALANTSYEETGYQYVRM